MFFGVSTLQDFHVLVSLVGIATGFVVLYGLLKSQRMERMTAIFLGTTLITLLTGFVFPFNGFTPAIAVGILGTLIIAVALVARYGRHMLGRWRGIYVITAVISLYLNVFVLVVQLFQKVPAFNVYAPTGSEPPFAIVHGIVLLAFIVAGYLAYRRFHPAPFVFGSPAI